MKVTKLPPSGNSSKFLVTANQGDFKLALSFTLRRKIWQLPDDEAELAAAQELAEAIVSRHDPTLPFKSLYILAEHNTKPTLSETVQEIRKFGMNKWESAIPSNKPSFRRKKWNEHNMKKLVKKNLRPVSKVK